MNFLVNVFARHPGVIYAHIVDRGYNSPWAPLNKYFLGKKIYSKLTGLNTKECHGKYSKNYLRIVRLKHKICVF